MSGALAGDPAARCMGRNVMARRNRIKRTFAIAPARRVTHPQSDGRARVRREPVPAAARAFVVASLVCLASVGGWAQQSDPQQKQQNNQPQKQQNNQQQMRGLDEQIQEVKSDVLRITAELSQLEEKLLYPSGTQVAVFVALAKDDTMRLDAVRLKIDGQHLNGAAPCYNPAHKHARPEESVEKLKDFWQAIYQEAIAVNPDAVIEICPCGTSQAFHNMPYMNQAVASDPESSWQVRHKGKTIKALMGPSAAYAGDHVELSDNADDFASTVGIGAIVSTKFTRGHDAKRGFLLTPDKETDWRKWIALYNDKRLAQGRYRGELYDIGFDKPEAHAIAKDGRCYYAFYADRWDGPIELRGLGEGRYGVIDIWSGRAIGQVSAKANRLAVAFEHFLLLEATPIEGT